MYFGMKKGQKMNYSPIDILDYIIDNNKEADFLVAITMHKLNYSIGEITDLKFKVVGEKVLAKSTTYNINEHITDVDIITAVLAGKYVSGFLSRYMNTYQLHFLVHDCMMEDKSGQEEEIAERVVQYMILKTIKQLRLDTPKKADEYMAV